MSVASWTERYGLRPAGEALRAACAVALCLGLLAACGGGGYPAVTGQVEEPYAAQLVVIDSAGLPVVGATVHLVPVSGIDLAPIDGFAVRNGSAEDRDEPLEDAVRLRGWLYPSAATDANGRVAFEGLADDRYFPFVTPSLGDSEHLPGGDRCRLPLDAETLFAQTTTIVLSSQPAPAATYLGSSACIGCHTTREALKTHAHHLSLMVPGAPTALQDLSRYPTWQDGWNRFLPSASPSGGTPVWLSDRDPSRGDDRFVATMVDPTIANPGAVVYARAWLWRDTADQRYKITLENLHASAGVPGPGDPPNAWTLPVELTYGGGLQQQVFLVSIPGRKGRYPLLQYQDEGLEQRYARTRKVFRDYRFDDFWNDAQKLFRVPTGTRTFEGNCTGCHSTGFQRFFDGGTGEWLSTAADDPYGAFDIDASGSKDEINVGCEACHGPGSSHRDWVTANFGTGMEARYIVTPGNLSPSRQNMLCGRCHDRPQGAGSIPNEEPLDAQDRMPRVGISRAEYLANHTTRKGPAADDLWSDQLHGRHHHQQYADLIKSPKYRNDRLLVVCSDCHGAHGEAAYTRHLRFDAGNSTSGLCFQCHGQPTLLPHMLAETGDVHAGNSTRCIDCHMVPTAQGGAGRYGALLAVPNGTPMDETIVYYTNDRRNHLFLAVPRKTHADVAGDVPSQAMPIPYTYSCGQPCHNPAPLQLPKPLFPAPSNLFTKR